MRPPVKHYSIVVALSALLALAACSDLGEPLQPECRMLSESLDFGQVATGQTATGTVTMRNVGRVEVVGVVALSGPGFSIDSGAGAFSLQPSEQLTVTVTFAPGAPGDYSATLSTGDACGTAAITGTGVDVTPGAACDVTPQSLDFGDVVVGSSADRTFTIRNVGSVQFSGSVGSLCTDVAIVTGGGAYTLAAAESLVVTARFSPGSAGAIDCSISTGADCGAVAVTGNGVTGQSTVSFAANIQPIFNSRCAVAGCHAAPSPKAGMDLSAGLSYANTVNVTSTGYAPAVRVVPGDTGASVLFNKITNTGVYGGGMPPGGPITASQTALIQTWILEGAKNN